MSCLQFELITDCLECPIKLFCTEAYSQPLCITALLNSNWHRAHWLTDAVTTDMNVVSFKVNINVSLYPFQIAQWVSKGNCYKGSASQLSNVLAVMLWCYVELSYCHSEKILLPTPELKGPLDVVSALNINFSPGLQYIGLIWVWETTHRGLPKLGIYISQHVNMSTCLLCQESTVPWVDTGTVSRIWTFPL